MGTSKSQPKAKTTDTKSKIALDLAKSNPGVDIEIVSRGLTTLETLRSMGISRKGYDLVSPYRGATKHAAHGEAWAKH